MIGDDITVGAGSVVTRNIQNTSMAVGSPARMIKRRPRLLQTWHRGHIE
jgi:serine acetyltransferase